MRRIKLRPLEQQVAVVAGGSSGIGRETALRLAAAGTKVVLAARNAAGHLAGNRSHCAPPALGGGGGRAGNAMGRPRAVRRNSPRQSRTDPRLPPEERGSS
ncbi:hypothetical protein NN3_20990 [Nocardia neocaledoniensis NBRC 108232]|uniref:SDR family NAD(P)-dependent oxidoreductase n=1 Tax=Nocardia neocaledoniensis TaxID=236511 RepID=UPI0011925429|nr:SDR family NAD(P)-dependent oxidoreductase [Nocardia neocaledoniensis]GEM31092.1 hypothetical protein NN3_20990 [Nocardia neocaledoniensis NBRC 108232]